MKTRETNTYFLLWDKNRVFVRYCNSTGGTYTVGLDHNGWETEREAREFMERYYRKARFKNG